ncbi:MAG: hypothetical protein VKJ24_18955, partial [Synechococcales bacterium]|nr:hypothetical protein [Synechococcales bacterium]
PASIFRSVIHLPVVENHRLSGRSPSRDSKTALIQSVSNGLRPKSAEFYSGAEQNAVKGFLLRAIPAKIPASIFRSVIHPPVVENHRLSGRSPSRDSKTALIQSVFNGLCPKSAEFYSGAEQNAVKGFLLQASPYCWIAKFDNRHLS